MSWFKASPTQSHGEFTVCFFLSSQSVHYSLANQLLPVSCHLIALSSGQFGWLYVIVLVHGKLSVQRSSQRWQHGSAGKYEKWGVMAEHICPLQGCFVFEERQERGSRGCHPPNVKSQFPGMFLLSCRATCRVWELKGVVEEHHLPNPLLLEAWPVFRIWENGQSHLIITSSFCQVAATLTAWAAHGKAARSSAFLAHPCPHGGDHPSTRSLCWFWLG